MMPSPSRNPDADIAAIQAFEERFRSAVLANDWDLLADLHTEDAVRYAAGFPNLTSRESIRATFSGLKVTEFSQTMTEIEPAGGWAYVVGTYDEAYHVAGEEGTFRERGEYLAILKQQPDGSWLLHRVMTNGSTA